MMKQEEKMSVKTGYGGRRLYFSGNGHNVSVKNPMPDKSFHIAGNSSKE